ncbi:sn-glycerol-1-phosphate dehydrogenase [Bacillus mesophilum]|uniref:sn-glycerol-1-phosphate dehydrogenase n=1 Tax=Bacillus mesophilum TaxID=1071718 RepID=A0A7V7UX61_9BACI|nr:sn-glycerol-1-phosphate dehydrogenase [Bacillus mesophilum]KAB2335646.1 sn-glycerol-1-phosphate dehydrogenase [Bacillus mesophilum]
MEDLYQLAEEVSSNRISLPHIELSNNALNLIPSFLAAKKWRNITIVCDDQTWKAAGNQLADLLSAEAFEINIVKLKPNKHNQVIADESAIVQLLLQSSEKTDIMLAVGAGTIHDIVRFVSCKMQKSFISVPTAASVDGFTSKGAPLIIDGFKKTIQSISPIAVFADIEIIKRAPRELTAAGLGDMLGKYTSLLDWQISNLIGNEPYHPLAAKIVRNSLDRCIDNVAGFANHDDDAIKGLMTALIDSGIVMFILDHSRPASGGEHHLSHYWEMELLKEDKKQILHGAKVGVATAVLIELYKECAANLNIDHIPGSDEEKQALKKYWEDIKEAIYYLPNPEYVKDLLKAAGGPAFPLNLGISNELVEKSLNEAYQLRDRCTFLKLINRQTNSHIKYPIKMNVM